MPISGKMLILKDTQNSQPFDQLWLTAIHMFLIVSFFRLYRKNYGGTQGLPKWETIYVPQVG